MPTSNYWSCLSTVQTYLQEIEGAPTVVIRRNLLGLKVDATPLWVVAPARGGDKILPQVGTFGNNSSEGKGSVWYGYPVAVAMIYGGNASIGAAALQTFLETRQTVRNTLYQVALAVGAGGFDLSMDLQEVSELEALLGSAYWVSGFVPEYQFAETRQG